MRLPRIAITGIGMVTPLGPSRESSWRALLSGSVAGRWLAEQSISPPAKWANFGAPAIQERVSQRAEHSRSEQFILQATAEAIAQANLTPAEVAESACVIGTSKPDICAIDQLFKNLKSDIASGPPVTLSSLFPSSPSAIVSAHFGIQQSAVCPVAACATGLVSLISAAEMIRHGSVTRVIAGSTDASLHAGLLASYRRLGVLADPGNDPSQACRPFDRNRNGFLVGEGAAVLILEDWNTARDRGAQPIAEWIDGQVGSDPTGLTRVDESGAELARLVQLLLDRNQIPSSKIDAISYHGTATRMNDLAEARAMQAVFGAADRVPIGFGIKGAVGHLMGAAGAVEAAVSVLALNEQSLPPTANYVVPDPEIPIPITQSAVIDSNTDYLLKTSLGFGGHLAVGLLKRV